MKIENVQVLDKGFVSLVDTMGDWCAILDAARVSYLGGRPNSHTLSRENNMRLLRYLWEHNHTSPFEMCEAKFHIKAPLFIARQWMRHRTASINERSGRYTKFKENEFYIPDELFTESKINKQKSSLEPHLRTDEYKTAIRTHSENSFSLYKEMVADGVSKELARVVLPVNIYTEWIWKIDLRNLLHFLELRQGSGAQLEIQQYANTIETMLMKWVPEVMQVVAEKRRKCQQTQ